MHYLRKCRRTPDIPSETQQVAHSRFDPTRTSDVHRYMETPYSDYVLWSFVLRELKRLILKHVCFNRFMTRLETLININVFDVILHMIEFIRIPPSISQSSSSSNSNNN